MEALLGLGDALRVQNLEDFRGLSRTVPVLQLLALDKLADFLTGFCIFHINHLFQENGGRPTVVSGTTPTPTA